MLKDRYIENARFLYSENAKVATQFWEWRHKVLTLYFTAITAVAIVTAWFYQRSELRRWICVPFLLAAVFCFVSDHMDRVNTRVLRQCYRVGREIEEALSHSNGIFASIGDLHYSTFSYHKILRPLYIGSCAVFLLLAILAFFFIR